MCGWIGHEFCFIPIVDSVRRKWRRELVWNPGAIRAPEQKRQKKILRKCIAPIIEKESEEKQNVAMCIYGIQKTKVHDEFLVRSQRRFVRAKIRTVERPGEI